MQHAQDVRIDKRNGLLASEDTPSEFAVEQIFEILPPVFRRWAEQEGFPFPPSSASSISVKGDAPLVIASPTSGGIFRLDPILRPEFQAIPLK